MSQLIKINFTKNEIPKFLNYLELVNSTEGESYNPEDTINNGLTKQRWEKIVQYLEKCATLQQADINGEIKIFDLTDVKEKINRQLST